MYRLFFELTDSAKLLHFTILGGPQTPQPPPLNDATDTDIAVKNVENFFNVNRRKVTKIKRAQNTFLHPRATERLIEFDGRVHIICT